MKLRRLLIVMIALGLLILMSGCSEEKKPMKNPFAIATTPVTAMVAEPKKFMEKEVVVGPLELHENRVAEGYFEASPVVARRFCPCLAQDICQNLLTYFAA